LDCFGCYLSDTQLASERHPDVWKRVERISEWCVTYRPSDAAEEVGVDSFQNLNQDIVDQIEEDTGVKIKSFNNRYHIGFFEESGVTPRRYSEDAIELFRRVRNGEDYTLDIPEERIPD